jgi:hypothetical protein
MTENCIKEVLELQEESEIFSDMTIEQLLYACVAAVGVNETQSVLDTTDWAKWCPNAIKKFDE